MTWFLALVAVLVAGGVAVVAAGRGGSMAEVADDRPDGHLPAEGPLTAADLEAVRFTTSLRGYRMAEVDALLDRLSAQLAGGERAAGPVPPRPIGEGERGEA